MGLYLEILFPRGGPVIKIYNEIPDSYNWQIVEEINRGWSNDKKYYVQKKDGREFLLRISDI